MPLSGFVTSTDFSRRKKYVRHKVTPSGAYTAGGDTYDLTQANNPRLIVDGLLRSNQNLLGRIPKQAAGYEAELIPGATLKTWKVKFFSAPGVELAAGAYPAALLADTLELEFHGQVGIV